MESLPHSPSENEIKVIKTQNSNTAPSPSMFTSSCGALLVNDRPYKIYVLKMPTTTMLFVNELTKCQGIDEMAVAMELPSSKQLLGTTIFSKSITSHSQGLAEKLSKRYHRQFFVSCNVQTDRLIMPILERKLFDYIQTNQSQIV